MDIRIAILTGVSAVLAGLWPAAAFFGMRRYRDVIPEAERRGVIPALLIPAGVFAAGLFSRFRPERVFRGFVPAGEGPETRDFLSFCVLGCGISGLWLALSAGFMITAVTADFVLLLPTFAAAGLLFWMPAASVRKKAEKRRKLICAGMPSVIAGTVLFQRAGLTVTESWRTVAEKTGGPLGEEMRRTYESIKNGLSPSDALAEFAVRCDEKTASRFAWLLGRNLIKGDANLPDVLTDFSREIREERKARARSLGGAASNALVLPLMLIFIGILMLVAIPLFGGNLI